MSFSSRKNKIFILGIIFCITMFFLYIININENMYSSTIVINEVCSNNFSIIDNNEENYTDYIELYNPFSNDISLDGYYLSDSKDDLTRYSLKGEYIEANSYLIIWPNLINKNEQEEKTSTFGISRNGEEVFLSKGSKETIIDYVYVPKLKYNTTYSRSIDGMDTWCIMSATAGMSNSMGVKLPSVELEKPEISVQSGFYEGEIEVEISASNGEKIYYTLNGDIPTEESMEYSGKIIIRDNSNNNNIISARTDLSPTRDYTPQEPVDKATVLRAVSYDSKRNKISDVATEVYFLDYEKRNQYKELPIISLVVDSEYLFNHYTGIYTNGETLELYKRNGGLKEGKLLDFYTDSNGVDQHLYMATNSSKEGKEWEREAHISFFDKNHEYIFSQNVGIRIAGASTVGGPQKSFNIYGRDIYDQQVEFPYRFFSDKKTSTVKLRNGGNHSSAVKFRDAFVESLVEDRDISIQRSTPCIVFLNGEYWGIYNIRERYNEEYISDYYDVSENNIWMIDAGRGKVGGKEAKEAYDYFVTMVTECDLTYDDVYTMVSELIDVQSFIDYCCINMYLDNTDLSFGQNMALWRSIDNDGTVYGDTKWRWMIFDMDEAIQSYENVSSPGEWMKNYTLMKDPILQSFLKNEKFRKQFYNTFIEIAENNFNSDEVSSKLDIWSDQYKEQLLLNHQRFFNEGFNEEEFKKEVDFMKNFFKDRYEFTKQALDEVFPEFSNS